MGFRLELCARYLSFFLLTNYVFMDFTLYSGNLTCWKRFGLLVPVNRNRNVSAYKDNVLYTVVSTFVATFWGRTRYGFDGHMTYA